MTVTEVLCDQINSVIHLPVHHIPLQAISIKSPPVFMHAHSNGIIGSH